MATSSSTRSRDSNHAGEALAGVVLDYRWRMRRRVGMGTFSEIYEASDLKQQRRENQRHPVVAVKVARDSHKCSMLQHEADILRDLQHSHQIARLIDAQKPNINRVRILEDSLTDRLKQHSADTLQ